MKENLFGIAFIISVLSGLVSFMFVFNKEDVGPRAFTETCSKVGGTTVWNGRNWECLK